MNINKNKIELKIQSKNKIFNPFITIKKPTQKVRVFIKIVS
jgi:hypothetical protein